ncbi:MAG: TonB-dependent receptor plug domain-containing protein [Verrucomicrobia bacterium]|nr:TonB-dependent receptor plug domain-containing protein [Verrucomicrobiota bacterium]
MNPFLRAKCHVPLLTCLLAAATCFSAHAQSTAPAATPPAKPTTAGEDEAVQLKEFVVSDSADLGYSTPNAIGISRTSEALIDTPQTINVINQQFLLDFAPIELGDVLQFVAGVTIESNVGDSTMIRGYTVRDQFTDGMVDNQNQSQLGAEPFQFERIEVLKGPAGLVYGSTAIGGLTNRVRKAPQWKKRGELAFTLGTNGQTKTEFDYTAPVRPNLAVRLVATYLDQDMVSGVKTRFAFANRWNVNPSLTLKLGKRSQLRVFGEFLTERYYKHWGEVAMFATTTVPTQRTVAAAANFARLGDREATFGLTQAQGGFTTWGLLPRNFTFGEQQSTAKNIKQATGIFYEAKLGQDFLLRAGGTYSFWDHFVEDVIPVGMAGNNREMTRTWRTIENVDQYTSFAVDTTCSFKLLGGEHRLFTVNQVQFKRLFQEIWGANPARPIPNLDLYNPVYAPYNPFDKVRTNRQIGRAPNYAFGFKDSVKFFGDKLQFAGGPRYDAYRSRTDNLITNAAGRQVKGNTWTYNYGAVVKPTKAFSLFYGHSETYAPNTTVNPNGGTFDPQVGAVNEFGLKLAFLDGRIAGTISTYQLRLEHIILNDPDPVRAAAGWRVDSGFQETTGYEADVFFTITRGWQLNAGGSSVDVTTPNGIFPRGSAKRSANLATSYRFSDGLLKGFAVGGGWIYKSKFNVEAAALTERVARYYLPAYAYGAAWASYNWKRYRFQLNVANVTDEWYLIRSVSKEQIFQGPERQYRFRVSRTF